MITINKPKGFIADPYESEIALDFRGLSTDEKPTCATNGSTFTEIDTGNVFCYDRQNKTWIPW